MKYPSFLLSNRRSGRIRFVIEPEGAIYEIRPLDTIEIKFSGIAQNAFEIQVHEDDEGVCLVIYPENSHFEINGLYEVSPAKP
ncbi:MAG TPA: hypothetical protein VHS96_17665 [Bacteroidia bacterium]|nr:hypothetical protein [Bacteroidia bacterium]